MPEPTIRERVVAAVHTELLPATPPSMRALLASCNDRRIRLVCYIDGYVDESMRTAIHHAGSHLMDQFFGERRIFIEIQQLEPGAPVPAPAADSDFFIVAPHPPEHQPES